MCSRSTAIDWNTNTIIETSISRDLNNDGLTSYADFNDWANLDFGGGADTFGAPV